ncbi:MAG: hypothetical protein IPK28_20100 [Devosia sp.]|nr:hypothetical protein [Devosia sp.]
MADGPLRLAALALCCALALPALPAVARQLGDFGRVQAGVLNDEIIPGFEKIWKQLNRRPASDFNWTDQEVDMHARVWRFLVAPQTRDWAFEYAAEIKPARVGEPRKRYEDRYYGWLRQERHASSRVRYSAMADHIGADLGTLGPAFRAICAVIEVDRQRAVAAASVDGLEREVLRDQAEREAENQAHVAHFVSALAYRYAAYSYALDHLLVETPHEGAVVVDGRLSELAMWVDRAEAGDFCAAGWSRGEGGGTALPSRVLLDGPDEGTIRK